MPNKTNGTTRNEKRYWKFKKTLDMLNIILHSAEKTMNKLGAKAKEMTCWKIQILRVIEGRVIKMGSTRDRE